MSDTPPCERKENLRPGILRFGMAAALGVGLSATIVTCFLIFLSSSGTSAVRNVGKLLIDTDAGADDAVAIIMALETERINGNIKVVGITCVNGNTDVDNVVVNVLKTLKVVDRLDVPVYKGGSQPLLMKIEKSEYFGKDGFGDFDYPDPPSTDLIQGEYAVNAMIELVKANPGEITLLGLGPLTNIALAIRIYPSFIDDLKQLIILGGSSEGSGNLRPGVEFNFGVDPAANYIVFNASQSRPTILVPMETTLRVEMTMEFRRSLNAFNNRKMWLINLAESVALDSEAEYWECADAIAASVALTSGIIVSRSRGVYVDGIWEGSLTAGMIVIDYRNITQKTPNTDLIQDIDAEEFRKMLSTLLS